MTDFPVSSRDEVVSNLEVLNRRIKQQMSVWHVLRNGVIYGMGFIIGSTVVTAVVASIMLQFFDNTVLGDAINWIAQNDPRI